MEPDDPQLRKLLREWEAPGAPPSLEERVLGKSKPWWQFLLTGHIRVPAPVGIAVAMAVVVLAILAVRDRAAAPARDSAVTVNLKDFRPVNDVRVRIIRSDHAN